eukprot:scaffold268208_cov37-Tisochrysis_lutea.AAC.1
MESVAALAPMSPPETGASSAATPCTAAHAATVRASDGVEVVISISIAPGLSPANTPVGPRMTSSTSDGAPTMVKTTSACGRPGWCKIVQHSSPTI